MITPGNAKHFTLCRMDSDSREVSILARPIGRVFVKEFVCDLQLYQTLLSICGRGFKCVGLFPNLADVFV